MADITISVTISAPVVDELLVRRLVMVSSIFARVCDETTVFSVGTMAFLGRPQGFGLLVDNLSFKLD